MSGTTRRARGPVLAAVLAAGALLGGCGETAANTAGTTPSTTTSPPVTQDSSAAAKPSASASPTKPKASSAAKPAAPDCTAAGMTAKVVPVGTQNGSYVANVVMTNNGDRCSLGGSSQLKILAGDDRRELPIKQVTDDTDVPAFAVSRGGAVQMDFSYPIPDPGTSRADCEQGGSFVLVMLPGGDQTPVEAWPEDRQLGLPGICGAVLTSRWYDAIS